MINQIEVTKENFEANINNGKLTARTQEEEIEIGQVKNKSCFKILFCILTASP